MSFCFSSFIADGAFPVDIIGGLLVGTESSCRPLMEGGAFLDVSSGTEVFERWGRLLRAEILLYIKLLLWRGY